MTSTTYSVIVRDPNSWAEATGIHEEIRNCGHQHKSFETASACFERLAGWHNGRKSLAWNNAEIEDSLGHVIDCNGNVLPTRAEMIAEAFGDLD